MSRLQDLLYIKFLRKTENNYYFECNINKKHPVFSGHFPDFPIVPGVCLINATKRAVSQIVGKEVSFLKIRECKFLSSINPTENTLFMLEFTLSEENEIKAGIFLNETQCMKLKVTVSY